MSDGMIAEQRLDPARIFEMMLAYKTTALLRTAIEVGVFDAVADRSHSVPEAARRLDISERGTRVLFNALAAMGLLTCDAGTYGLATGVGAHLVSGRPGYVGDMVKVMASSWEWQAFGSLTESVRRGGPVGDEDAETPEYRYWEDFAAFAGAVARPTAALATQVLSPWAAQRKKLDVLDVACGHGLYGYTLAAQQAHARVWSLDWPNVLPLARKHAAEMGVADRVTYIGGDMFDVPLGGPYDAVLVTNVLHHFSPERGVTLLKRLGGSMTDDGRLALVGFVTGDRSPLEDAQAHLFSVLMLVWTQAGEVHSDATYQQMLREAGFSEGHQHEVPGLPLRVIVAERSGR